MSAKKKGKSKWVSPTQTLAGMKPEDRMCFKLGLATMRGGKPTFDWRKIEDLWIADPSTSLADFCRRYHIMYEPATKNIRTSSERKAAIAACVSGGYVLAVTRALVEKHRKNADRDAEMISSAIAELSVFARSAAAFARARMMKMDPSGKESVNVDAKSSDVSHYAEIAKNASTTIKNILELQAGYSGNVEELRDIEQMVIEAPKRRKVDGEEIKPEETKRAPRRTDRKSPDAASVVVDHAPGQLHGLQDAEKPSDVGQSD